MNRIGCRTIMCMLLTAVLAIICRAARQLPDQSTILWVDSSSTSDSRLRGALPIGDVVGWLDERPPTEATLLWFLCIDVQDIERVLELVHHFHPPFPIRLEPAV